MGDLVVGDSIDQGGPVVVEVDQSGGAGGGPAQLAVEPCRGQPRVPGDEDGSEGRDGEGGDDDEAAEQPGPQERSSCSCGCRESPSARSGSRAGVLGGIPDAANGADQGGLAELLAQEPDPYVDDVRRGISEDIPAMLEQPERDTT